MNESELFDQLAFQGYTKRQLVELVAAELTTVKWKTRPDWAMPILPGMADIEKRAAELVARHGKLAGMGRKHFVNEVWKEVVRIFRREAKAKGLSRYVRRA